MRATQKSPLLVSLLGFSDTERIMLTSMFQLSSKRLPSYQLSEDPFLAEIIVVNAEDTDAIADLGQLCTERPVPSVWVGGDASTGGVHVPRPITWNATFEALDSIVQHERIQDAPLDPSKPRTIPLGDWIATPSSIKAICNAPEKSASQDENSLNSYSSWALVVARNPSLRGFLAQYLAVGGFNTEEIDDVRMAVAMNATRHYFCVFIQSDMPGVNGFTLCRLLRTKRQDRPRIILVLPEKTWLLRLRAYWAGADSTFSQPITRDVMRQTVIKLRQEVISAKPK